MKDYNTKPTYKLVPSNEIYSDPAYQRPVDKNRVKKIVQEFNPAVANPIKVSVRDGKYWVFDGQHTLTALKVKNGGKDLMVPCIVYTGLTQEDEAFLFATQTGISSKVKVNLRLRALYLAGDPNVMRLHDTLEGLGVKLDFTDHQGQCKIVAYSTIYKIFLNLSQREFVDMMKIILKSWPDSPERLSKEMLNGMYYFFAIYGDEFDKKKAVTQFSKVPVAVILQQGKAGTRGGDKRYARELVRIYNKNLRKKLDEYKLNI